MNIVTILGRITKDPELSTTTNGVSVTNFTVAVQRKFKNASGEYESDFLNCIAWRKTAEFIHNYFKKGQKIALVGSIQTRSYDAQDGTKRYIVEIVTDTVEFVEKKSAEPTTHKLEPIESDTLPF